MKRTLLSEGGIIAFFLLASLYMTYPQIMSMGSMVGDPYNDLSTAYLIGEGSKIWINPQDLLNARFYFPHSGSLASAPGLIGMCLLASPVYLVSGNAIVAFNFYLVLGFFLNGLGMFYLARNIIKNTYAAIIAGFIFAYCPFRFSAPQLVTMMSMFWICLALLFLHKFVESGNQSHSNRATLSSNAVLFAFFFGMQFLTDPSSGMFYLLMLVAYFIFHFATKRVRLNRRNLLNFGIAFLIIAPMLLAAIYPSFKMMHVRGAEDTTRGIEETQILSCDASAYLVTAPTNLLYGWITKEYRLTRAQYLFPGVVAGILFFLGLFRKRDSHVKKSGERGFLILLGILGVSVSLGPYIQLFGFRVCPGPYMFLYRYLPGFRMLRAIGWSVILSLIPFAIFCGEGAALLLGHVSSPRKKAILFISLLFLILVEYFNRNASGDYFTARNFYIDRKVPAVYEWLKYQKGDFGVLELPMPENDGQFDMPGYENYYMLWSLYHGKRIVNGYAGFPPVEYWPLADMMMHFPSPETIDILRSLGVRYVIVHADRYDYNEFEQQSIGKGVGKRVVEGAMRLTKDLRPVGLFGSSYVFAILPAESPPDGKKSARVKEIMPGREWRMTASIHPETVTHIFDRDPATAWDTMHNEGLPSNGNFLQVDFGTPIEISRISLDYRSFREYPRGLVAEISMDGTRWERLDVLGAYRDLVIDLLRHPEARRFEISCAPRMARYLRLSQTQPSVCWSVKELHLYSLEGANADHTPPSLPPESETMPAVRAQRL